MFAKNEALDDIVEDFAILYRHFIPYSTEKVEKNRRLIFPLK